MKNFWTNVGHVLLFALQTYIAIGHPGIPNGVPVQATPVILGAAQAVLVSPFFKKK